MQSVQFSLDLARLKAVLEKHEITGWSFCTKAGLSKDTWSRITRGQTLVAAATARKITAALGKLGEKRSVATVLKPLSRGWIRVLYDDSDIGVRLRRAAGSRGLTTYEYMRRVFDAAADPLTALSNEKAVPVAS